MHDHPVIETARLVLRPLAPEHAAALNHVLADPQAMRYWHEPSHRSVEQTRAMIDAYVSGSERAWALVEAGGDAIGIVYYLGNVGAPGMGYILGPRRWGNGFMSEAVQGALAYGFETLGFDRVELWIDNRNLASQRLAERVGFTRRAAFRQKYPHETASHEKLVYGLRVEEWRPGAVAGHLQGLRTYSLQPILAVADVRATAEYYRDKLGFQIGFTFGEPPTYAGLWLGEWSATGANIHLSFADPPLPTHGIALYINVGPGIDELHAAFKARGVGVAGEVAQQPWGMREFAIRDCNGYVLRFGTPG
jgi:RimJ/RimL family protein N-acetyltransferase/catechol 2,3-dioxygenase-like lactoylglutathione lyase family enzyme